jgi:hypothetical protein
MGWGAVVRGDQEWDSLINGVLWFRTSDRSGDYGYFFLIRDASAIPAELREDAEREAGTNQTADLWEARRHASTFWRTELVEDLPPPGDSPADRRDPAPTRVDDADSEVPQPSTPTVAATVPHPAHHRT